MAKSVKPIPDGYHSVTPYLIIGKGKAGEAIAFYVRAFNAKEIMRMPGPEGGIAHAEIQLGDSRIMLADEAPKMDAYGPDHFKGSPITLHVYVPDVDAITKQATAAGATVSPAARRPVLWRPDRRSHGSFWPPVVSRHPRPRRLQGGDGATYARLGLSLSGEAETVEGTPTRSPFAFARPTLYGGW